jgi:hypothetical protein
MAASCPVLKIQTTGYPSIRRVSAGCHFHVCGHGAGTTARYHSEMPKQKRIHSVVDAPRCAWYMDRSHAPAWEHAPGRSSFHPSNVRIIGMDRFEGRGLFAAGAA